MALAVAGAGLALRFPLRWPVQLAVDVAWRSRAGDGLPGGVVLIV